MIHADQMEAVRNARTGMQSAKSSVFTQRINSAITSLKYSTTTKELFPVPDAEMKSTITSDPGVRYGYIGH